MALTRTGTTACCQNILLLDYPVLKNKHSQKGIVALTLANCCALLALIGGGILATQPVLAQNLELQSAEPLQTLLRQHLQFTIDDASIDDSVVRDTLFKQVQIDVSELLATEGYFATTVSWQDPISLRIEPGARTTIETVTIEIDGPIEPERRAALLGGWSLPVGEPFVQQRWTRAKQELLRSLTDQDFPAARIVESKASINPDQQRASLTVRFDSGRKHQFGPIHIVGLQHYDADLIKGYNNTVQEGAPYRRENLLALQSALQNTAYFSSVDIRLLPPADPSPADPSPADRSPAEPSAADLSAKPGNSEAVTTAIQVTVSEYTKHRLAFGLGASSNTGPRVQLSYFYPYLFGRPLDFASGLKLETNASTAFGDIFLPRRRAAIQDSIGASFTESDYSGLEQFTSTYRAARTHYGSSVETQYSLTLERSTEQPDEEVPRHSQALVPGVSLTWRHIDSMANPRNGGSYFLDIAVTDEQFASSTSMRYLNVKAQQYISLAATWMVILRGEFGLNEADDLANVPQRYLFRTGGSTSIRGFNYVSIGEPVNDAIVGARALVVLSAELHHWFNDNWGGAVFYDTGDAKNVVTLPLANYGYGIGLRYATPAGPLAFDLARGNGDNELRLHFAISVPF